MERNPYSPPETIVADIGTVGGARATWANVILIYWGLALFGTFGSVLVLALGIRNDVFHPLPGAAWFFGKLGLPWFTLIFLTGLSIACAFVQLLRSKRSAAYFATAGLALILINWVWVVDDRLRGGHHRTIQNSVGLAINLSIAVYLWRLVRKGVLK